MIFSCLCPPFIIIMIIKCNRIHDHSQGNMLRLHTVHLESNGRLRTQTQRRHHLRVRQRENAWRVFARLSRPSYSLIMTTLNSCLLGLHLIPPPFFSCVRRSFLQQTKTHEWMCCVTFSVMLVFLFFVIWKGELCLHPDSESFILIFASAYARVSLYPLLLCFSLSLPWWCKKKRCINLGLRSTISKDKRIKEERL